MTAPAPSLASGLAGNRLAGLVAWVEGLPESKRLDLAAEVWKLTGDMAFVPTVGPQYDAYYSLADELFFGGSAGCGKSALICGLAVTEHRRSILFRREHVQVKGLEGELERIIGSRDGYNSQAKVWRLPGSKMLEIGSVQHEGDQDSYQGNPHDLIAFDELPAFTESQYTFLIGWNRSADPRQRCRVVSAGNPPMTPEGLWVLKRWAPWLDPTHPNPAKSGELRWFTMIDGKDTEVDGPGPHTIDGRQVTARSRTFIPGKLEDNPDLYGTGYAATIEAMPEPYRTMLREGRFDITLQDHERQVIPTAWVREAIRRWKPKPPGPMSAIGLDVAGGGTDSHVMACRHDWWFDNLMVRSGKTTPLGRQDVAAMVVERRRNNCPVVIDMGGGWGGPTFEHLLNNGIECRKHVGNERTSRRSRDGKYAFYNKRAELWWRFREALDPSQDGGSAIALPDDPTLIADLTAPHFDPMTTRGIQVEPKEALVKRLGRSPDRGDAVVMAWSEGTHAESLEAGSREHGHFQRTFVPRVIVGHAGAKRGRAA